MTRTALLIIFLLNASLSYAGFGPLYFFKCKLTTNDTTVVGYFLGYGEQTIPDSVLVKLKTDKKYFENRVFKNLNKITGGDNNIELNRFIYVHNYTHPDKGTQETAIFRSKDKLNIVTQSILTMELLDILIFQFAPNKIISKLEEKDRLWLNQPVRIIIQSADKCYPFRFLIYDDTIDYNKIVKEIMKEADQEEILERLSENKILGLRLNLCD